MSKFAFETRQRCDCFSFFLLLKLHGVMVFITSVAIYFSCGIMKNVINRRKDNEGGGKKIILFKKAHLSGF